MTRRVGDMATSQDDHGVDIIDQREHDKTPCSTELLDRIAWILRQALTLERVSADAEVSLTLVDTDEMAALNAEFMGAEAVPTDVLSFPIDGATPGDDGSWMVGDVIVCPEVAAAQAPTHAGTFEDELGVLVIHSALHLCGWDHYEEDERNAMWARERELAAQLLPSLSADPWQRRDGEAYTGRAN